MSMHDIAGRNFLLLVFNAVTWDFIAENDTTGPTASIFVSLHTALPVEGGDQTSNEITTGEYGQYARIAVARTAGGWTVAAAADPAAVDNAANITWVVMSTGTGATITHFGMGRLTSGAGEMYFSGALTGSLVMANGVTPQFNIGDCNVTVD